MIASQKISESRTRRRSTSSMMFALLYEQLQFRLVLRHPNHAREPEAKLLQHADRSFVRRVRDREQTPEPQFRACVVSHGGRRLERVALFPVRGKEGKAEIGVRERV